MRIKASLVRRFISKGGETKGKVVYSVEGNFEYSDIEICDMILKEISPEKREETDTFELWIDEVIHD